MSVADLRAILRDALREWKSGGVYYTYRQFRYRSNGSVVPWSREVNRQIGPERFMAVSQWLYVHGLSVPDEPEAVADAVLSALADRVARELERIREELGVMAAIQAGLAAWGWPLPHVMEMVEHLARSLRLQVKLALARPPLGVPSEDEEEVKA